MPVHAWLGGSPALLDYLKLSSSTTLRRETEVYKTSEGGSLADEQSALAVRTSGAYSPPACTGQIDPSALLQGAVRTAICTAV